MEDLKKSTNTAIEDLKSYAGKTVDLYKLQAAEKGSLLSATIISWILIGLFSGLTLLFASIATAILLNKQTGSDVAGYWLVTAFYGIIALIFFTGRNSWLRNKFANQIIRSLFKEEK